MKPTLLSHLYYSVSMVLVPDCLDLYGTDFFILFIKSTRDCLSRVYSVVSASYVFILTISCFLIYFSQSKPILSRIWSKVLYLQYIYCTVTFWNYNLFNTVRNCALQAHTRIVTSTVHGVIMDDQLQSFCMYNI